MPKLNFAVGPTSSLMFSTRIDEDGDFEVSINGEQVIFFDSDNRGRINRYSLSEKLSKELDTDYLGQIGFD